MTDLIESRIKVIKEGKLPEGYKRTKAGIMPVDWDGTIQAKKLFKKHTDKKHDGDLEILAATQERGIVPRSQIGIDIQCSDEGVKGYKKVSKGDFVISLRSFQGGIEYSEYTGIISPAYTVLKPIKDISTGFYRNYFKTDTFIKRLNGAVYGIRDGKQIGYEDFGDMYVHCPPLAEQERIAEILIQCDRVIELKEQKLDELKQLKKEFLRKMFPAKGCDTPEIRFPGFTGAWEQRKAKDLCSISTGKSNTQDRVGDGIYPFYVRSPIVEHSNRYLFDEEAVLTVGDGVGTGKVFHYVNGKYDLHQRVYRMFDFSEEITAKYFYYYFSNHFYDRVMAMTAKTSVDSVRYEMIADMDIALPKVKEQMAISAYFDRLDHLITLHQRELEETKTYKKTLAKLLLTGIVRVQG